MTKLLTSAPTIQHRPDQPYVGITRAITMTTFHLVADRIPDVIAWLAERGVEMSGPPFFRYDLIDMERELIVEAGVPVATMQESAGHVVAGVLPGGRYVTATYVGHPQKMVEVTTEFLAWADEQGLEWDRTETPEGTRWGCRLELLKSNPASEPDMNKWETELVYRLAD
jgi:hypothetical protein